MSEKLGFGYKGAAVANGGNRNIVFHLLGGNEQRIYSLAPSYFEVDPAAKTFKAGRIIVIEGKLSNAETATIPSQGDLGIDAQYPVLFDAPIYQSGVSVIGFGSSGLVIQKGKTATVILIAPVNDLAAPNFTAAYIALTVQGEEMSRQSPFINVR